MLLIHLHPTEHLEIKGPRSLQRLYANDVRLQCGKPLAIRDDGMPVGTITLISRTPRTAQHPGRVKLVIDLPDTYRVTRSGRGRVSA